MKTINFVKNIVIVIVALCGTTSANAQNKAMSSNDAATVASLGNIHFPCYDVSLLPDAQGFLAEKQVDGHSGLDLEIYAGFNGIKASSEDGSENVSSASFGAAASYGYHKKNWFIEPMIRAYAEINTSVTIETLSTKAFAYGGEFFLGFNPCGAFRSYVGYGIGFINSTSKKDIDNESFEAHIPYKGNPMAHGPRVRFEIDIFKVCLSNKVDRGVRVKQYRSASLILQGKYEWYTIEKPMGGQLDHNRLSGSIGIAFPVL